MNTCHLRSNEAVPEFIPETIRDDVDAGPASTPPAGPGLPTPDDQPQTLPQGDPPPLQLPQGDPPAQTDVRALLSEDAARTPSRREAGTARPVAMAAAGEEDAGAGLEMTLRERQSI